MTARRVMAVLIGASLVGAALGGCSASPPRVSQPPFYPQPGHSPGQPPAVPSGLPPEVPAPPPPAILQNMPDAVPRPEPRSHNGNPAFYDVFGKRYFVLSSATGYVERGVASWYGPGFHEVRTSTGEPYDMYAMTAAHKTLPLPAYARVTNLQNGRSVVVRVNDRGPFVGNRIIDLSYTAAAKLDMLREGTAIVEVRAIDPVLALVPILAHNTAGTSDGRPAPTPAPTPTAAPAAPPAPPAPVPAPVPPPAPLAASRELFIQAGAFADPANAERMAARLRGGNFGKIFVRDNQIAGRRMYRVRIGPVPDVAEFDRIVAALEHAGINDAHLALD